MSMLSKFYAIDINQLSNLDNTDSGDRLAVEKLDGNFSDVIDLKAFSAARYTATNACSGNHTCSHICLGSPNGQYNCLCYNGHFKCPNDECISNSFVCDGQPHCSDGSDELNCLTHECGACRFKCKSNGICIPR